MSLTIQPSIHWCGTCRTHASVPSPPAGHSGVILQGGRHLLGTYSYSSPIVGLVRYNGSNDSIPDSPFFIADCVGEQP